jgi:hypothetical protein
MFSARAIDRSRMNLFLANPDRRRKNLCRQSGRGEQIMRSTITRGFFAAAVTLAFIGGYAAVAQGIVYGIGNEEIAELEAAPEVELNDASPTSNWCSVNDKAGCSYTKSYPKGASCLCKAGGRTLNGTMD